MALQLTYTLIADGSSDSLLLPIIRWLLAQHLPPNVSLNAQVPEWGRFPIKTPDLRTKLRVAQQFYPADVYFLHRDREKEQAASWEDRRSEIDTAVAAELPTGTRYVRVIPIRMTEAWLLHNEAAIRQAADNPNGRESISLPSVKKLEALPNPKEDLLRLLRIASGLSGRRLRKFEQTERRRLFRLVELQQEHGFAHLRQLAAFDKLEREIVDFVQNL